MPQMTDPLLAEFREEAETTRRVLQRIPPDQLGWKPHEKSMSVGQLAIHIANIPGRLSHVVVHQDTFEPNPANFLPTPPKDINEVHSTFEQSCQDAEACLSSMNDEHARSGWTLIVQGQPAFTRPRIEVLRRIMFNHWYHHRGQLTVYLRLLNVSVPVVYGRSADEGPFTQAAAAD